MRATRWIIAVLLAVLAVYSAWPFEGLHRVARAIDRRDVATISRSVEFRALRASVNRQVLATYLRITGKEARLGPFGDLALSMANSAADALLADINSAERLVSLFGRSGEGEGGTGASVGGAPMRLLPRLSVSRLWDLYMHSEYGLGSFTVAAPPEIPVAERFTLQFRLIRWSWKLYDVQLPERVRIRLAQELMRAAEKP